MGLLERDDHLATLVDRLEQAGDAGHLVLIAGEAGSGKTALVEELRARHLHGRRVLVGRCDDLFAARPLGPVADIARQASGPLADALASGDRAAVFEAFLTELASSRDRPVVVVLEDLQWADEATLDLVRFVARRLDGLRGLVIATHRDDLAADHPLRRAWGSLVGPLVTRLTLHPLSVAAVAELAAGSDIDAASLHARTGGNPFFVVEVLASEHVGLPMTVRDTILARAAHLTGSARDGLDAAAILGRYATGDLVAQVGECDVAAIDECVAAGLVVVDTDRLTFRHDLTRETIEDGLTPLRRRQLHRRALEALGDSDDVVQRAHHALGSGDRDAIVDLAVRAADSCVALGAHVQAASLYAGALVHEGAFEPADRLRIVQAYAKTCTEIDRLGEGVAAADRAYALLLDGGDDAAIGEWETWLGTIYWTADRGNDATVLATRAVERLERLGPSAALADARAARAGQHMVSGRFADAVTESRRALELAEEFGTEAAAVRALNAWGVSTSALGDHDGIAVLEEALDRAKRAGLVRETSVVISNLGERYRLAGQLRRSLDVFSAGIALAEDHELLYRRNCLFGTRMSARLALDQWDDAIADADVLLAQGDIVPHHRGFALVTVGRVRARRGDPGATEVLDQALGLLEPIGDPQYVQPVRVARTEASWLAGDDAVARDEITALIPLLELLDIDGVYEVGRWASRLGLEWAAPPGLVGRIFVPDVAVAGPRAVAAWWSERGCGYEAADVLGDSDDESDLREAHERLLALGARPRAQMVARRLRDLGARDVRRGPRATTRANAAGLTAREAEVAALLAEGLTNAEIADRLVLSPKTVDHHVSSVLSKLGVASRRHVAGAAARAGLAL